MKASNYGFLSKRRSSQTQEFLPTIFSGVSTIAQNLVYSPQSLWIDSQDNIWVTCLLTNAGQNYNTYNIYKITPQGVVTLKTTSPIYCWRRNSLENGFCTNIVIDSYGYAYYATGSAIYQLDPSFNETGRTFELLDKTSTLSNLCIDSNDRLYCGKSRFNINHPPNTTAENLLNILGLDITLELSYLNRVNNKLTTYNGYVFQIQDDALSFLGHTNPGPFREQGVNEQSIVWNTISAKNNEFYAIGCVLWTMINVYKLDFSSDGYNLSNPIPLMDHTKAGGSIVDGPLNQAVANIFQYTSNVVQDSLGNLYFPDLANRAVRKITVQT